MRKLKNVFFNIKRIIKWLPILWKDRDWDYSFILIILQFKIRQNRKYISKYGLAANKDKIIKEMKTVENLLERLADCQKYTEKDFRQHYSKWKRDSSDLVNNLLIPPSEQEYKEFKILIDKEIYMWNQDMDYTFKMLKKHLRNWWD